MDGGVYSIDNADLAAGYDRVLILTLKAPVPPICVVSLRTVLATLRGGGARTEVILPDDADRVDTRLGPRERTRSFGS
ncbi:MAG TPA: hypothetical protein VKZ50_16245 [bacterium]|nr:hypothetical protein [bacterium]